MDGSESVLFGRSEVRRAILARLFSSAEAVHASALARDLHYTPQAVARELRRLERAGIVRAQGVGRALLYGVDLDSPVAREVGALVQRTIGIEGLLRGALAGVDGVEEAFVFGSYAAGDVRGHSDVDLLVIGAPDQEELSGRLAAVEQRVGRDVNVVTYTRDELERLVGSGDGFLRDVLAGPRVRLISGDDDALPSAGRARGR